MFIQRPETQNLYYGDAECQSPVQQAIPAWCAGGYAAYDFTAATYAAAKLDLTGNLRHATDGAAYPTHTPGVGCTSNGVDQYLITPVVPANNSTWSMAIKFSGVSGSLCAACGSGPDPTLNFYLIPKNGAASQWANKNYFGFGTAYTSGVLAFAGTRCFSNGVYRGTMALPATGLNSVGLYIFAVNSAGAPALFSALTVSSLIVYDTTRSDAQIAATSAAMP